MDNNSVNEKDLDNNMIDSGKKYKKINMSEYMKEYRKTNMDKWYAMKTCEICGCSYKTSNTSNHLKTEKHKYAVLLKQNEELIKENSKLQHIKTIIEN